MAQGSSWRNLIFNPQKGKLQKKFVNRGENVKNSQPKTLTSVYCAKWNKGTLGVRMVWSFPPDFCVDKQHVINIKWEFPWKAHFYLKI